jgi:Na+-transporting NADH:ubiquinone oxidoreductase subunit C
MRQQHSNLYIVGFAAAVCFACSLLVSTAAVTLKERQETNALLEKRKNVLMAAGMISPGETVTEDKVNQLFKRIQPVIIDLGTGEETEAVDPAKYDPVKASRDPQMSFDIPPNRAQVPRMPKYGLIYKVMEDGQLDMVILPIQGKGLWSTLYGFLALRSDLRTVQGITYYQHGETPGLGGEVDNPKWKGLWEGRKAYNEEMEPALKVVKGSAGPPSESPYQVDGLSGATITSNGVSAMLDLWLGEQGYGPYIEKLKQKQTRSV